MFGNNFLHVKGFFSRLVAPKSKNLDDARSEFILNTLLIGSIILIGIAFAINVFDPIFYPTSKVSGNPFFTGSILVFVISLLILSRFGKSQLSAFMFIWPLFIVGVYVSYFWGTDLPSVLLLFALLIVMAGILIGTKFAFIMALLSGCNVVFFSVLEIMNIYKPHNIWKTEVIHITDSFVYAIILIIIAIVSWLSNREIEKSLIRARISEAALRKKRDKLEILIEKRTKELKIIQAEKLAQLYRFAKFGRMASGLFHDLATPLNLVSLNLDRLRIQSRKLDQQKILDIKILLKRAIYGTQRLENFVEAARKQVQNQNDSQTLSLKREIQQSVQLLEYQARKAHVEISMNTLSNIKLFGNSIKFNQLVTNLVSNAIDAYSSVKRKTKNVEITLQKINDMVRFEVKDFGSGIAEKDIPNIFEPLFTTKSSKKGMGMGLSICKDIVEKDFKGKCTVISKVGTGTIFIIEFPIRK